MRSRTLGVALVSSQYFQEYPVSCPLISPLGTKVDVSTCPSHAQRSVVHDLSSSSFAASARNCSASATESDFLASQFHSWGTFADFA